MHNIYIASYRRKLDSLKEEFGDAQIFNITSKSPCPLMKKLSPMYCHENIIVPFSDNTLYANSVEAIWQGLKVFENEGANFDWFKRTSSQSVKRVAFKCNRGKVIGHQQGIYKDRPLLNIIDARRLIYAPTYKFVLDNLCQDAIKLLKEALNKRDIVLLDAANASNICDIFTPMPHAELVKLYLLNQYPSSDKPWLAYSKADHERDILKRKLEKKARIALNKRA